jgi:hypothetical protein
MTSKAAKAIAVMEHTSGVKDYDHALTIYEALGKTFDIRGVHEQVLMTGALPLEVLDAKIDRWIAAGGK